MIEGEKTFDIVACCQYGEGDLALCVADECHDLARLRARRLWTWE